MKKAILLRKDEASSWCDDCGTSIYIIDGVIEKTFTYDVSDEEFYLLQSYYKSQGYKLFEVIEPSKIETDVKTVLKLEQDRLVVSKEKEALKNQKENAAKQRREFKRLEREKKKIEAAKQILKLNGMEVIEK
jgi:hypothetical protein